jgi:hypothetical protein
VPVHAGGLNLSIGFHSTSRITLRRFIRSRACTTSFLSSTASRRSNRSGSVARPGLNVFPKDAPSVLKRSQNRLLVGTIHDVRNSLNRTDSRLGRSFRSSLALRFNVSATVAISRALGRQPRRIRGRHYAARSGAACHAGAGPPPARR